MVQTAIHKHVQATSARQREHAQSAPRPSRVRYSINTTGVGETRLEGLKSLNFGATMLEEPSFSFGVVARQTLPPGSLPLATATILRWKKDSSGMWVGADIGFKVQAAVYNIRLQFSLTFEGSTLRSNWAVGTSGNSMPGSV